MKRTMRYLGNVEIREEDGVQTWYYYIGNALVVRQLNLNTQATTTSIYQLFTDNLGSVTAIFDSNGDTVFEASYDAWGNQTTKKNDIGYHRGYTGHEMLPEFGLINMNGRLYDPVLGQFLSPDNYVQDPTNSQNFNRYAYCLNNPLKYTDPSGDLFGVHIIFNAIFETAKNFIKHGLNLSSYDYTRTQNAFKIELGMFQGNFLQILNKWTCGLPLSLISNHLGQTLNTLGYVKHVSHLDGAVALETSFLHGEKAFTIGHMIYGPENFRADWRDHLFVHEYGHYVQGQMLGFSYIPVVGIPSLLSTKGVGGNKHKTRWFEVNASYLGARHFVHKYGKSKNRYSENISNYFDINIFYAGGQTSYMNPRTHSYYQSAHPTIKPRHSGWDWIIPIIAFI